MRLAFSVVFLLSVPVSALATPRLDSVSVQVLAGKGNDVVIAASIERPSLLHLSCDALIDAGDGTRIPISWAMGDARTKTARYEYKQPGRYRVRVAGHGKDACAGAKETSVTVGPKAGARSASPRCPGGWQLVDDSVQGASFTCRARPPVQPLRCPEGTMYFAQPGEIGCKPM